MACSYCHLTNSNISDQLAKFVTKGRLQLLETNAVNNTYYPNTYNKACTLCGFYADTNSHALNSCSKLRGLFIERHDRCVDLVRKELEKTVWTEFCQVFTNERVTFEGLEIGGPCKPDICVIDHLNSVAFVIEISNPFDAFLDSCYNHKFNKYIPLNISLSNAGFQTKTIVLVVGSLGTVHKRFVKGLMMLGLSKYRAKNLAKYISLSVMIGSRRAWARRGHLNERA